MKNYLLKNLSVLALVFMLVISIDISSNLKIENTVLIEDTSSPQFLAIIEKEHYIENN